MKNILALMTGTMIAVALIGCAPNTAGGLNGSTAETSLSATAAIASLSAVIAEASPSATAAIASPSAVIAEASPSAAAAIVLPSGTSDVSPNVGTPITITIGDTRIAATLNDSDVARDFAAMLPVTLPWFRNYGIEYITELDAPLTETGPFYTDVQPGDIVYYNPLDSVTIIYKSTSSVPTLTKMGEITSDMSVFEGLPDNVDMRIELR